MNYRTLLVHLDPHPRCDARIAYAAQIAAALDAHVIGLAPSGLLGLPLEAGPALLGLDVITTALADLRRQAEQRCAHFRERCTALGVKSFEAVADDAPSAESIVAHAPFSDLVVIGQADLDAPLGRQAQDMVERVALNSARPTLVLPYAGRFEHLPETVLVAWDGGREAARAVADALPLLQRAQQVHVLRCSHLGDAQNDDARPQLDALHRWLMWHGVDAQVHLETTEIAYGDAMLSRAADLGADLLVMGAYGHPRWTERVMGGVTRNILEAMTLPVLLSH